MIEGDVDFGSRVPPLEKRVGDVSVAEIRWVSAAIDLDIVSVC